MTEELFLEIIQQSVVTAAQLVGPLLLVSTVVGLMVGLFQTVTSINEMTLTFIPKIVITGLCMIFLGPWMLGIIMDFSKNTILSIPTYLNDR